LPGGCDLNKAIARARWATGVDVHDRRSEPAIGPAGGETILEIIDLTWRDRVRRHPGARKADHGYEQRAAELHALDPNQFPWKKASLEPDI
jgi:hypothetical protein